MPYYIGHSSLVQRVHIEAVAPWGGLQGRDPPPLEGQGVAGGRADRDARHVEGAAERVDGALGGLVGVGEQGKGALRYRRAHCDTQ